MIYSKIEGSGIPFLIIHGFLGMADNWKTLGNQFAENGFEVHLLEMRNHGRSFHSDVFNYDVMVQDVKEYCLHHNLTNFILLGHSMGGKVAMQFAAQFPELVKKIIIADIGPKYYAPHHQTILAGLQAVNFNENPSRSEVDATVAEYISDFGTRQFLLKSLFWKTKDQLAFRFNLDGLVKNINEIGAALSNELKYDDDVLFIRGGESNYILDADIESIKKQFPKAVFDTIPNAGHWLHAENPQLFYELVIKFVS